MRVLFDNLLNDDITLSATNENTNYPVERVYNNTLESKFKATSNVSVITAEFTEDKIVSSFAFGEHNIETVTITFYNSSDVSIGSYEYEWDDIVFNAEYPTGIVYLNTPVSGVRKITFDIIGLTTPLYIGGLYTGQYYQMPYFSVNPTVSFPTTSDLESSDYGVGFEQDGETLEKFKCTFDGVEFDEYDDVVLFLKTIQINKPVYLDRWEDDSRFRALFCSNTTSAPELKKGENGLYFSDFTLDFKERK